MRQRYERVLDILRGHIASGEWPPGTQLPSRSELRNELSVSDTVLDKAFMMLRMEGLTETLPGVGVFVAGGDP